ncbi:hypothetical protein TIFTF001_047158, partial [Ficus carica]
FAKDIEAAIKVEVEEEERECRALLLSIQPTRVKPPTIIISNSEEE